MTLADLGAGLFIIILVMSILLLIFWIKMMIRAIKDRAILWVFVMVFFPLLGAVIYWLVDR